MAIYTWKCKHCENTIEIVRPIAECDDPPFGGCSKCMNDLCWDENDNLINDTWERIIAPTSFVLSGGGWYKDGYQKEKK